MENKHLHDYINNLVENDSFIQWVHSDFEDNNEEWSVFIDENMDQMVEINQAIKLISSLQFKENNTIDSKSLWSRINNSISSNSSTIDNKKPRIISLRYKWAVAAAACIGLFYFFMPLIQTSTTISSGIAQQSIETLPDGSIVRLDASSSITYKPKKWLKEREVKLSGVAFFEVKKGSKFVVFTDKGQVEVLGTSFNINARDEKFEVICKTGKVAVSNNGNSSKVTLNPGQKSFLKYNQLTLLSDQSEKELAIGWLDGVYKFENEDLSSVILELERQYEVKCIISDKDVKNKYTGFFKKGNLNEAIYSITWPLGLTYRIDGNSVFITKDNN